MTPTPTLVYFVRHGQTAANAGSIIQGHTDVPLDETGLKQADIVAKRLSNTHFDVIYSSDLSRALVTAKKISGSREVITTPQLREWHLGHWQGRSLDEIKSIFRKCEAFPEGATLYKRHATSFIAAMNSEYTANEE